MSSTAKVLLVLGSIAGVCMLACCGVGGVVYFKYKDTINDTIKAAAEMTSNDPAVVKKRTQETVHIEIPEEFTPVATWGVPLGAFSMKQFIYQNEANPNSMLLIMATNQPLQPGQDAKQQREEMLQSVRQGPQMGSLDMQEESREARDFTINGEEVPFEFIKGKAHGVATRKVMGAISGRQGTIMLILIVAESDYNDEKIVNMIKSIRLPGDATPAVSGESDEPPEKMPADAEEANTEDMEGETETQSEPASP